MTEASGRRADARGRWVVVTLVCLAGGLQALTYFMADAGASRRFLMELVGAAWAPHLIVGTVALVSRALRWWVPALVLMLLADFAAFLSVFVWPTDAQAGLVLLFMPLWNLLIVTPVALLSTALVRWVYRRVRGASGEISGR